MKDLRDLTDCAIRSPHEEGAGGQGLSSAAPPPTQPHVSIVHLVTDARVFFFFFFITLKPRVE